MSEIAALMRLRIESILEEARGVKTFVLRPPDASSFSYKAGQFLTFIHHRHRDEQRCYSLSSSPGVDALPAITVKRVDNGVMSRYLIDDARPGDMLETTGDATGIFTLPDASDDRTALWLFAAGIGITPVISIIGDALHNSTRDIVLVYSNTDVGAAIFFERLQKLEAVFRPRLRICYLWSDARNLRRARLSRESFAFLLEEYLRQPVTGVLCYTCGPPRYMWLIQLLLQEAGVPATAIRREVFSFDKVIPHSMPPDVAPHLVHIAGQVFSAQYPDTILAAARKAGVSLPYSCEVGQCGSCAALCTGGQVWMSYNEVLTDGDLAAGRVLTCTGYAVGGNVALML